MRQVSRTGIISPPPPSHLSHPPSLPLHNFCLISLSYFPDLSSSPASLFTSTTSDGGLVTGWSARERDKETEAEAETGRQTETGTGTEIEEEEEQGENGQAKLSGA